MILQFSKPICVLEDSDEDFNTVLDALRESRMLNPVVRATDGDACLDVVRRQWHRGGPSFVLMDLGTHGTDGREALRRIKGEVGMRDVPVVIFTSSADPRDTAYCYANGANAYHIKPVQYADCLNVLRSILRYWLDNVVLPVEARIQQ